MIAAKFGKIEKPNIARRQSFRGNPVEKLLDRIAHDAQVSWDIAPLRDEITSSVG